MRLRPTLLDGKGHQKIINLTASNVDWKDWRYIDIPVDENWPLPLPLLLLQIYAVETNKDRQRRVDSQGKLYFDNLRFVYVNDVDYAGPVYSDPVPLSSSVYQDSLHFSVV